MAEVDAVPVWDSPHMRDGRRRLASAIDALDPALPIATIGRIAVEHAVGALGGLSGGCWLLTEDGTHLELVADLSATDTTRTVNARLAIDADTIIARAVREGEALVITAGTRDLVGDAAPDRTVIALPMIGHDDVTGVIGVTVDGAREVSRADLAFGVTLAQLCAGALRRARPSADAYGIEPALVLADQLRFSSEASALLAESLEVDRVADVLAHLAVPRLGDGAAVFLSGDDGPVIAAVAHVDSTREPFLLRMLRKLPITTEQGIGPGAVLRTGRTEHLPTLSEQAVAEMLQRWPEIAQAIGEVAPRTGLLVPLVARGRVNGVLALARDAPDYSGADLLLAEELGRRGALAVDNARLYAREREAAVTLQRSLLPPALPDLPGLSVAARYLPGTAGTEAGGDWYDVISLPQGRVGLAIGDVMGRGLRAAAVMGQVSAALRAYALDGASPSELLTRLDRLVSALHGTSLTTCAYAVFDPATGALRVSLAGHPPPLRVLYGEEGVEASYIDVEPGLPLGVEVSDYPEAALALPRGGALVLYTDGLVESRTGGIDPGLARLQAVARQPRASGRGMATALADDIVATLAEHRDEADDTALLVLVRETALVATWDLPDALEGASVARREIESVVDAWGLAALRDEVVLLVSELVTNALRHARPPVRMHAEADDHRLRIGVDDGGAAVVLRPRLFPPVDQENGRGLALLETLSSRWGMVARADGKTVWFELDRPPVDLT